MISLSRFKKLGIGMCLGLSFVLTGCLTTGGQKGAVGGAGFGALAGQVIGRNTESTLIGAGIGLGLGYIIGNEIDKKNALVANSSKPEMEYSHNEVGPLGGTRWQVESINPQSAVPPFVSKMIKFTSEGYMITTTTNMDGTIDVDNEHFRVVGNTLIINAPGYLVNARYSVQEDQLVIDTEAFNIVLRKL